MIVVCLGDSLTFGEGVPPDMAWPALLGKRLGCDIVNAGVNGDRTAGMQARFNREVLFRKADVVTIMGGANDFYHDVEPESVQAAISSLVARSLEANVRPVIGIPVPLLPSAIYPMPYDMPDKYNAYRRWLYKLAMASALPYLDFYRCFLDALTASDPVPSLEYLFLDGLHPNKEGHALMAEEAVRVLGQ